jgi:hypothetical protein
MSNNLTTDYTKEFQEVADNIDKLVTTPNLIKEIAINTLQGALNQQPSHSIKTMLTNGIKSLQNIQQSSITNNFKVIHSQMCILTVSALEAILKQYFINACSDLTNIDFENERLKEIKITARDLVQHKLKYTQDFGQLILENEKSNFQDLKAIKRVFSTYFNKEAGLKESDEKAIAFYLECRHVLVHRGGKVDQKFIESTSSFKANIKNYKLGESIEINDSDWRQMKAAFTKLVAEITKKETPE